METKEKSILEYLNEILPLLAKKTIEYLNDGNLYASEVSIDSMAKMVKTKLQLYKIERFKTEQERATNQADIINTMLMMIGMTQPKTKIPDPLKFVLLQELTKREKEEKKEIPQTPKSDKKKSEFSENNLDYLCK